MASPIAGRLARWNDRSRKGSPRASGSEAEAKKQKPTGVPSEQLFAAATEAPKELPAGDVTVIGAREQAEDNVVASQSEEPITVAEVPGESAARTLPPHSGATRRSRARHRERTSSPS